MRILAKIGIGPMSREIVELTYKISEELNTQLMLIASTNQVGPYWRGYVEGWNSEGFINYTNKLAALYPKANVLRCRDHLGPGFMGVFEDNLKECLCRDLEAGFELIHLDVCYSKNPEQCLRKHLPLIISTGVPFEVGTEENIGASEPAVSTLLPVVLEYGVPEFFVVQTGSLIRDGKQVGTFNLEATRRNAELLHSYGIKLKEHNADYITCANARRLRTGCVDAVKVAPEFGTIQTIHTLNFFGEGPAYKFINKVLAGGKWEKWLRRDAINYTVRDLVNIAGHYHFNSSEFRDLSFQYPSAFKDMLQNSMLHVIKGWLDVL